MNKAVKTLIHTTDYDRAALQTGVVHLGFGAFHRAHQAVYLDDYIAKTAGLHWGIAAVNLRAAEAGAFASVAEDIARHDGYYLKSYSHEGKVELRRVRSHSEFLDWSVEPEAAEALLGRAAVKLVTITVTESGYYTGPSGGLNPDDPVIADELNGGEARTVYAYLRAGLRLRMLENAGPITIACCDNIRQNGKMLKSNLSAYLGAAEDAELRDWVDHNVAFPCSMVDRITPRSPESLGHELSQLVGETVTSPIMAEDFSQWVLEDVSAADMPDLARVGVDVTNDVDPYEETKIRVLNGGHTALAYLAALEGIETFDAAMRVPHLHEHFKAFEVGEVLPAIANELPFSKDAYLEKIISRFSNQAIGDTIARICADGMAKFAIFIRPTLRGCLAQGQVPIHSIRSIAGWHQFARHVDAGKIGFEYIEPSWRELQGLLGSEAFLTSETIWGDLPQKHPEFVTALRNEISEMELKWPV